MSDSALRPIDFFEEPDPHIPPLPQQPDAADLRQWIVEHVAHALKTAPDTVNIHQPFTEMGLDSITALTITGDLAEALDRELPQTLLWDYPTIASVAAHLGTRATAPAAPEPNPWPAKARACGLAATDYESLYARTASWDAPRALPHALAITIRATGTEAPLYWICDLAGTRPLSESLPNRPVHALPSGFGTFEHTRENVRALAAYYVEEITVLQPSGPCCLGGYCYGAKVALEMARLLRARGRRVAGLLLLEWPGPDEAYWKWYTMKSNVTSPRTRERIGHHLGEAARLGPIEGARYLSGLKGRMKLRRRRRHEEWQRRVAALSEEERRLAAPEEGHWEYRPEPYDGRVLLVLGRNSRYHSHLFPRLGWQDVLTGPVHTRLVAGDHFSVLHHPDVDAVARLADAFFKKGASRPSSGKARP
jgi:thioesterase domain-containing protein/acyl carrier protein